MNANSKAKAPLTIHKWVASAREDLHATHVPTPELDAELILAFALDVDRTWLHAHSEDTLPASIIKKADALLSKRTHRIPLAYLTGTKEFYGRDFIVTPDVLIPRPESEMMIDLLKELPLPNNAQASDIGTGSGCLGLTAKLECPQIRDMFLCDISSKALTVAKQNNRTHFHITKVQYYQSDLLKNVPADNDVILANLPYVDEEWERSPETNHEPAIALFAKDHGLALIYELLSQAPQVLATGGYVLLEADPEQHNAIITEAKKSGLAYETTQDYIVVLKRQ